MVSFIVCERKGDLIDGHGLQSFKTTPRIGEIIQINDNDKEEYFKVIMIVHPTDKSAVNDGNIYVKKIGTHENMIKNVYGEF